MGLKCTLIWGLKNATSHLAAIRIKLKSFRVDPSTSAGVAEWLSRWPRDRNSQERGLHKQASGPLARRGSSPFPGAILLVNFKIAFLALFYRAPVVTETLKQRAIYVYLPSEEQKGRRQRLSEGAGVSISKFVIEHVENSLRQEEERDFKSRSELWKENNELEQRAQDLSWQVRLLDTVVDKLEQEFRRYRGEPFLEEQFEGVRNYDKKLIDLLKSKEIVTDEEIFSKLGIVASDGEGSTPLANSWKVWNQAAL
jgi:hypothetical protein